MSVQNQPEQTMFETTDKAISEAFIALLTEFTKAEAAPLRAYNGAQTAKPAGGDAELAEIMKEMITAVDFETDKLIVSRLVANNRKVPLLRTADANRIVLSMFQGEPMSEQVAGFMTILAPIATLNIEGNLMFLTAFDPDPYTAFWQFAAALTSEAVRSERTLKQIVVSSESRANVYRTCMTYQTWRKLTTARCALIAGISPSSLYGKAGVLLADDEVVELEEKLAKGDEASRVQRTESLKRCKEFYTRLGQEIWPTGTRY